MNAFVNKRGVWREALRELLFPQGCALCGKSLCRLEKLSRPTEPYHPTKQYMKNAFYGLCPPCREKLAVPAASRGRCSCCGQPLISEMGICLPCRNGPERSFDRVISLYPYWGKYQKVLSAYKFGKRLSLGNFFITLLYQGLEILLQEEGKTITENNTALWVPVPPKPGKIKHSGWDQIEYLAKLLEAGTPSQRYHWTCSTTRLVAEQVLQNAQHFAVLSGSCSETEVSEQLYSIPVCRCLIRLPSENQKELNRENRLHNLKGRIAGKTRSSGVSKTIPKTAILFDDIYTTGSTMDACAAALKSLGAEKVYGICLCYD
jgi:predicted amidophosphoribosyltransferase